MGHTVTDRYGGGKVSVQQLAGGHQTDEESLEGSSSQRGPITQRADLYQLKHKNQKKSMVKLDQKIRQKERNTYNSNQNVSSPTEDKKQKALRKKQIEDEEELKQIQEQSKEKFGLVENKLNRLEHPQDYPQTETFSVRGQRNLKEFMQSKRKNMQTATSQIVNPISHDKLDDTESGNKFKTLFKKEDGISDPDINSQSTGGKEKEMFDLSALHKRNERHRQIQASRSGIYEKDDIENGNQRSDLAQTQRMNQVGRYSNIRERPSPVQDRLNTDGSDPLSKRGKNFHMKLNPNFMKKSQNADVIVSPRSGAQNMRRTFDPANTERAKVGSFKEPVDPASDTFNKMSQSKAPLFKQKRTSSTRITAKNSPKIGNSISTIRFNRQAEQVVTKPKNRSKSGTLLDQIRSDQQRSSYNNEQQEFMETGIIIKTPDDRKKAKQERNEEKDEDPVNNNNINILIYEGPQKDSQKLRKQWSKKQMGDKQMSQSPQSSRNKQAIQTMPTPTASNAQTGFFGGEQINIEQMDIQNEEIGMEDFEERTNHEGTDDKKQFYNTQSSPIQAVKEYMLQEKQGKKPVVNASVRDSLNLDKQQLQPKESSRNRGSPRNSNSSRINNFKHADSKKEIQMVNKQIENIVARLSPDRLLDPMSPKRSLKANQTTSAFTKKGSMPTSAKQSPKRPQTSINLNNPSSPSKPQLQNSFARASSIKAEKESKQLNQQVQAMQETQNAMLSQLNKIGEMMKVLSTKVNDLENQFQQQRAQQAQIMHVLSQQNSAQTTGGSTFVNQSQQNIYPTQLNMSSMQQPPLDEQQAKLQLIMRMRDELDQSIRTMQMGSSQIPTGFNAITSPISTKHHQLTGSNAYQPSLNPQLQQLSQTPSSKMDDIQMAHLSQQIQSIQALHQLNNQQQPQNHLGAPLVRQSYPQAKLGVSSLTQPTQPTHHQQQSSQQQKQNSKRPAGAGAVAESSNPLQSLMTPGIKDLSRIATPIDDSLLNLSEISGGLKV